MVMNYHVTTVKHIKEVMIQKGSANLRDKQYLRNPNTNFRCAKSSGEMRQG